MSVNLKKCCDACILESAQTQTMLSVVIAEMLWNWASMKLSLQPPDSEAQFRWYQINTFENDLFFRTPRPGFTYQVPKNLLPYNIHLNFDFQLNIFFSTTIPMYWECLESINCLDLLNKTSLSTHEGVLVLWENLSAYYKDMSLRKACFDWFNRKLSGQ